ncbi:hypothetical protein [Terracoccus sp. 273MFTsu3.1]|uniref:hypothetical protein n=1 Tax=Terracoccus sp. 273MFTsu3.1 TaxID=1172188 RepID=UPI0003A520F6|nr:hypothetical protein [Terracoccus sp. 273MFTsu3.1]
MSAGAQNPTNDPMTNPAESSDMSSTDTPDPTAEFRDPTADPAPTPDPALTPGPTPDPAETTTIPSTSTQALPASTPFRVEPATPVPDDAVAAGARLPHLPPPTTSAPDPSWPAPTVPTPAPQPAPRPALVTVRKGPRPGSIMLGLLTMLVAAYILVANLTDADLSFRMVGPSMVGAFGGMLLLVGLAGVVAGRMRR